MNQVGAFEAKNTLGTLLDRVERGEEVIITRRGKPIAKLVPAEDGFDRARARRAVLKVSWIPRAVSPSAVSRSRT